jgi:hypothetical protein
MLCVTFGLMSIALLSNLEISMRTRSNGADLDRAERAAISAIEWSAARLKRDGFDDGTSTVTLATGLTATVQYRPKQSPNVLAEGRSNGVAVTVGADVSISGGSPRSYAFVSYAGTSVIDHQLTIDGKGYFGDPSDALRSTAVPVLMTADANVVNGTPWASGVLTQLKGQTRFGWPVMAVPVWNTRDFATLGGSKVPVHVYTGRTTLQGLTIDGIVVVTMPLGEALEIDDCVINGTVVVTSDYPPILEIPRRRVVLKNTVVINGGTEVTGNLALLAPSCRLEIAVTNPSSISGVTYVYEIKDARRIVLEGLVMTRGAITSSQGDFAIARPDGWEPDVPVGITWPPDRAVRLQWRGRQ